MKSVSALCLLTRKFASSSKSVNPFKRVVNIFKDDMTDIKDRVLNRPRTEKPERIPTHCDVLIIGGGVIGSSIAYWLKKQALDGLKVVVVERDCTVILKDPDSFKYRDSSTVLSVGGLRQQFSLKENIELSLYAAEFLRNIGYHLSVENADPPDIQFNPGGYLFLATDKSAHILEENVRLQKSLGAKVELLTPEKLKAKFPWMVTEGVALGSYGIENEGWFDPWSLLTALKRKSISLGADYVEGEVQRFNKKIISDIMTEQAELGDYQHLESVNVRLKDGREETINFSMCVIAAGPHSGHVGRLAGMGEGSGIMAAPLPVQPRKRYVYTVHCPDGPGLGSPMFIDSSGTYFRREGLGGNYLCGRSPLDENEPPVDNLDVDYEFFEKEVWPILAARVPAFNNAKLKSAWAGYYDFNYFDENGFIGPHPAFFNLYLATGFSGHGIQQAPAVGRAIMELIIDGEFKTIDLTRMGFERYLKQEPLWESNIV